MKSHLKADIQVFPENVERTTLRLPETPRLLFKWRWPGGPGWSYDLSPDGQRFAMVRTQNEEVTELHVVLNWFEELKRLVPTN